MPPPVPASPVAAWWATDLEASLDDGDPVSSWTDYVNGVTVTQTGTARPWFDQDDGVNYRPGVAFDGVDDWMGVASTLTTATSGCCVAVVQVDDASFNNRSIWSSGDHANNLNWIAGRISTGDEIRFQRRSGSGATTLIRGNTPLTRGTAVILEWQASGGAYTFRMDNVVQTLVVEDGANNGLWFGSVPGRDSFTVGIVRRVGLASPFDGVIAYLGFFNAPLSSDDRAALYEWLIDYYAYVPPPPPPQRVLRGVADRLTTGGPR